MALGKEMMGCSLIEKSLFVSSSKLFLNCTSNNTTFQQKQNRFLVNPVLVPLEQRRVHLRKVSKLAPVVAAISEDLIKAVPDQKEKAVKFKVRAVVTVRNKNKEDFKETLVKHLDAFTEMIGRNVVLQLISTEEDPSKSFSFFWILSLIIHSFLLKKRSFVPISGFSSFG